jgi:hypothetical protein
MSHVLCPGTELKHRQNLCEGIDGQPEPEYLCGAAQPRAHFVQLDIGKLEIAEIVLMQRLRMLASARQPGEDRGLPIALRPVRPRMGPVLQPAPRAPWRSGAKGFSIGTKACRVAH